jgi:hypothetical protein
MIELNSTKSFRVENYLKKKYLIGLILTLVFCSSIVPIFGTNLDENDILDDVEVTEYEGKNLSSIDDFIENSIRGPQFIDPENYNLTVSGLVDNGKSLSYDEVVNNYTSYKKVVTLYCVEGWKVTILWEGILIKDLLADFGVDSNATTVIFIAYDGYSTSLPLDYVIENDSLLAYKMNNVILPPERGFPFQLVAESKWGYKWIKWITEINLSSNEEFRGYWESRGYSNEANLNSGFFDPAIPEFPSWTILLIATIILIFVTVYYTRKLHNKN